MKALQFSALALLTATLIGCGQPPAPRAGSTQPDKAADAEATIKAALATLSPIDREMAEGQKFCAVAANSRLGSMGAPVKITVKPKEGEEQTVWLCCKGCEKQARADEAKTAARATELYIQGALASLSPADRKLAEAQKFCIVDTENPLGGMGAPDKYIIKDKDGKEHPVFVCCKGCIATIKQDEAKALATLDTLLKKNAAPKVEEKK